MKKVIKSYKQENLPISSVVLFGTVFSCHRKHIYVRGGLHGKRAVAKLISGKQLREARMLAGLTIEKFAELTGYQPRTVRHWEAKGDKPPTNNPSTAERIEEVLLAAGVEPIALPDVGTRLRELSEVQAGR